MKGRKKRGGTRKRTKRKHLMKDKSNDSDS